MAGLIGMYAAITGIFLRESPLLVPALACGMVCTACGLLVALAWPDELALFFLAQPLVFTSWEIGPIVSLFLEIGVLVLFLAAQGYLATPGDIPSLGFFFLLLGGLVLFLMTSRHVAIPLAITASTAGLAALVILGIASLLVTRVAGGSHGETKER